MTSTKSQSKSRAVGTASKRSVNLKEPVATAKRGKKASSAGAKTSTENGLRPPAVSGDGGARPKAKLVRDSFTIPKAEYQVLDSLKIRAANLTRPVKKSELLRAGIAALEAMSDVAFLAALSGVPSLKTGRPKGVRTPPASAKRAR